MDKSTKKIALIVFCTWIVVGLLKHRELNETIAVASLLGLLVAAIAGIFGSARPKN